MYTFSTLLLLAIVIASNASRCLIQLIPDQIRLACAGDNGVSVGWQTYACRPSTANPNPNPTVIYGLSRTALIYTSVNRNSSVYDTRNTLRTSWFFSVELQNLRPSTVYYYQIVSSNYASASAILSFTSASALGDRSQAVSIATYADLGVDGLLGDILNGKHLFEQALGALQKSCHRL